MVMTKPSVVAVVSDPVMLEECKNILKLPFDKSELKQTLGYDT